jgi:hypothetical protein
VLAYGISILSKVLRPPWSWLVVKAVISYGSIHILADDMVIMKTNIDSILTWKPSHCGRSVIYTFREILFREV